MNQQEQNKAIVMRFYEEVWNNCDVQVVDEIFLHDYKVNDLPRWREPGAAGLKAFILDNHRMFPDAHHTVEDLVAEDDKVAAYFVGRATHKGDLNGPVGLVRATGKKVHWNGMSLFWIKDGKIVRTKGVVNNMSLMQQLGAVPSPKP